VLVCYLDDSGGDGDVPAITIGGYVAGLLAWEEFEPLGAAVLQGHGVDCLHGKKFHHSKDAFKGWGSAKKRAFVEDLYTPFRSRAVLGVAFSGMKAEMTRVRRDEGLNKNLSHYGAAFLISLNMLLADPGLRRWLSVEGIDLSFIVETGHKNDGDLVKVFNIVKKALERKDGMGQSISFADKKSCVAIQMGFSRLPRRSPCCGRGRERTKAGSAAYPHHATDAQGHSPYRPCGH